MGLDAKMRSHGLIRCDRKRAASSLTGSPIQCVESLKSYILQKMTTGTHRYMFSMAIQRTCSK